jgi:hypothetical protein
VDVKWGDDLCYLVGEKMYCVQNLEGAFKVSFKTTPEESLGSCGAAYRAAACGMEASYSAVVSTRRRQASQKNEALRPLLVPSL